MDPDVVRTELEDLTSREPFLPFRISLLNGQTHEVKRPDDVMLLSWGLYVSQYVVHWASFTFESIVGFDSLIIEDSGEAEERA